MALLLTARCCGAVWCDGVAIDRLTPHRMVFWLCSVLKNRKCDGKIHGSSALNLKPDSSYSSYFRVTASQE
jgi:hypothetical protein